MLRPIAPTNANRHQLGMRMRRKMMMTKTYARQVISIERIKTRKHHLQACHKKKKSMFTSRPGASLTFYMFINLFITLSHTISFHLFYSHCNWFNKIDIVIWNVDQYGELDLKFEDEFTYCKYTVEPFVTIWDISKQINNVIKCIIMRTKIGINNTVLTTYRSARWFKRIRRMQTI